MSSNKNKSKVLWNKKMSQCIGFATDIDKKEFIAELKSTYIKITGKELDTKLFTFLKLDTIWVFTNLRVYIKNKIEE